jgi:methyltransferase (TIGR00027 family)
VKDGTASHTARSVAARRLEYERAAAPYGEPAADEALTSDVADGLTPARGRMHEYIRARTAFFDRVVVRSIDHGITQVVIGGAGYDGRAFRYAKPGVRWFEVDHPATQADKRERIIRLGLATPQLSFIPADFTADPVAGPLLAAGLDPARPALFLFEGVAVYLDRPVTERVLAEFRAVTPAGSTLAISVSIHGATSRTRARFQQRVAELGEPARTVLTFDQATGLLLARAATASDDPERKRLTSSPPPPRAAPRAPAASPAAPVSAAPPASLPVSALLSQALVAFTIEADNETEHRLPHRTQNHGRAAGAPAGAPWLTSLLMYANCLRHLPDEGITIAELAGRARTATNLDGMRRWGYVTFTPDPGHAGDPPVAPQSPPDRRARVHRTGRPRADTLIRPTDWGSKARDTWRAATEEVESRWRGRLGDADFAALRAALAGIVEQLDPLLPDCLPVLSYGLLTRRDQPTAAAAAPRTSAASPSETGPVTPPGAAPVTGLPLWALLSRPLLAFARQYEAEPGLSLAISANVLRVLPTAGVHTKDIPALGGVSRESVAMALGVLRPQGVVTEGPDPAGTRFKVTRLTAKGITLRDEYPALAAEIERDWRARFGDAKVTALRRALEPLVAGDPARLSAGLEPYPDGWRARLPRPATLPHYPMTLHRGGYPDGS